MKKVLVIALTVLIGVAFVTTGFAATKATKEKSVKLKGEVVKNDGKEMVVKGPKGEEKFDVSGVKNVDKYKEGDTVTISYKEKDGMLKASSISKSMMKGKMEKEEMKESTEKKTNK
jgi:hypothetical protein